MSSRVRNTNAPIVQAFRPTGMRAAPRSNNPVQSIGAHSLEAFREGEFTLTFIGVQCPKTSADFNRLESDLFGSSRDAYISLFKSMLLYLSDSFLFEDLKETDSDEDEQKKYPSWSTLTYTMWKETNFNKLSDEDIFKSHFRSSYFGKYHKMFPSGYWSLEGEAWKTGRMKYLATRNSIFDNYWQHHPELHQSVNDAMLSNVWDAGVEYLNTNHVGSALRTHLRRDMEIFVNNDNDVLPPSDLISKQDLDEELYRVLWTQYDIDAKSYPRPVEPEVRTTIDYTSHLAEILKE